ncbi:MAG: glycosyltransferase [Opitutales bacterium]|nr:glycosyltransferase [Opitutales bacterium]
MLFPKSDTTKEGWPWSGTYVEAGLAKLADQHSKSSDLPKISIITPSYNQGNYLEETIRSIILQGYQNLEFIVIDGGSTDQSVGIIQKYSQWIDHWESEKDRGQTHAINKGFDRATGVIGNWINSDDLLEPNALERIADKYNPQETSIICGDATGFYEDGHKADYDIKLQGISLESMICFWQEKAIWEQPAIFFPLKLYREVGKCDETQHMAMDYDLWCRMLQSARISYLNQPVCRIRRHNDAKTYKWAYQCWMINKKISQRYWKLLKEPINRHEYHHSYCAHCVTLALRMLYALRWGPMFQLLGSAYKTNSVETTKLIIKHFLSRSAKLLHLKNS